LSLQSDLHRGPQYVADVRHHTERENNRRPIGGSWQVPRQKRSEPQGGERNEPCPTHKHVEGETPGLPPTDDASE